MKLLFTLLLAVIMPSSLAIAKPSIVVTRFVDQININPCNVRHVAGSDPTVEMARQLIAIFSSHSDLRIANLEKSWPTVHPRYSVTGTLRSFDQCRASASTNQKTKVAIEMRVIDNRTHSLAFIYTSSANAIGSTLSETATVVLYDLAFRVERALSRGIGRTRLVSRRPERIPAHESEYQVKLVRRPSRSASF